MDQLLQELLYPSQVFSRRQILDNSVIIPSCSGMYAWFFLKTPTDVPTDGCIRQGKLTLLYIGIAPFKRTANNATNKRNLRKRIIEHFRGNAESSTLRLSLGCLLSRELGIELRRIGNGKRMTFTKLGESKLSEWMDKNAYVTWIVHPEPWKLEDEAIKSVLLPLNLRNNESSRFSKTLSKIRIDMKEKAKSLSIVPC